MTTIPETLAAATQHHQAGKRPQAESLYRQILKEDAQHADALHFVERNSFRVTERIEIRSTTNLPARVRPDDAPTPGLPVPRRCRVSRVESGKSHSLQHGCDRPGTRTMSAWRLCVLA